MQDQKLLLKAKKVAESAAVKAGEFFTASKNNFKILNYKDSQDILTNIDLEAEKIIIKVIQDQFPEHNIFSEEAGMLDKASEFTWVIDPLDGTKEYIRNIPLYCSAIMLEKDGEAVASAIYDPELKELYSASFGGGAYCNGEKIAVSKQSELSKSMLFTYLPRNASDVMKLAPLFDTAYRIRGHANHNMSYCWVAKGGYEAHFSLFTPQHWWDVAPGILILREAGGMVTDLSGNDVTHKNHTRDIIGTNGKIHKALLDVSKELFSK